MNTYEKDTEDTIDLLLDYRDDLQRRGGALTDQQVTVFNEGWLQQDLYPCETGEPIREAIVAQALAELRLLEVILIPESGSLNIVFQRPPAA